MTYPASEMIANTISEAIKTADRMSGWDYFAIISSAIAALGTIGLLFWEMNKSYKERARVRSITTLQKIEKQHQKIISFLFKNDLPNNDRILWNKAYLELQKLHSIDLIETPEIREEAESDRSIFIEQLKSIEKSDPVKTSLRWQFFTGIDNWEINDQGWDELLTTPIDTVDCPPDQFGNFNKINSLKSLTPDTVIAIYHYMYTGKCPELAKIILPNQREHDPIRSKQDLERILKVEEEKPNWLIQSQSNLGLIHYLLMFYQELQKR